MARRGLTEDSHWSSSGCTLTVSVSETLKQRDPSVHWLRMTRRRVSTPANANSAQRGELAFSQHCDVGARHVVRSHCR